MALKLEWMRERGIKPPLTKEQKDNLAFNQKYIATQWMKARNNELERQKAIRSGRLKVISGRIPLREEIESA